MEMEGGGGGVQEGKRGRGFPKTQFPWQPASKIVWEWKIMKTTAERKAILAGESRPWDWLNPLSPGSQRAAPWVRAPVTLPCPPTRSPLPLKVVSGADPLRGPGPCVKEPHSLLSPQGNHDGETGQGRNKTEKGSSGHHEVRQPGFRGLPGGSDIQTEIWSKSWPWNEEPEEHLRKREGGSQRPEWRSGRETRSLVGLTNIQLGVLCAKLSAVLCPESCEARTLAG